MIHITKVKVGDYIVKKEYDSFLTDGTIIFYEKKKYKVIDVEVDKYVLIFYVASEIGRYQLTFDLNHFTSINNKYAFISLSEDRLEKIKSFL